PPIKAMSAAGRMGLCLRAGRRVTRGWRWIIKEHDSASGRNKNVEARFPSSPMLGLKCEAAVIGKGRFRAPSKPSIRSRLRKACESTIQEHTNAARVQARV